MKTNVNVCQPSDDVSTFTADASEVSAQGTEEEEEAIVSEAVTEATENNTTAVSIAVGESARR